MQIISLSHIPPFMVISHKILEQKQNFSPKFVDFRVEKFVIRDYDKLYHIYYCFVIYTMIQSSKYL